MTLEINWKALNLNTTYELTESLVLDEIWEYSVLNSTGCVSLIYILEC